MRRLGTPPCCTVYRELRPYPEELDNNWFYPASAPVLSFHQVSVWFPVSRLSLQAATVLCTLAHAPESSPDWTWEHYCQEVHRASSVAEASTHKCAMTHAGNVLDAGCLRNTSRRSKSHSKTILFKATQKSRAGLLSYHVCFIITIPSYQFSNIVLQYGYLPSNRHFRQHLTSG